MNNTPTQPGDLTVLPDGTLQGANSIYTKLLGQLDGIYQSQEAFDELLRNKGQDWPAYQVDEHRSGEGRGALIIGTSTLQPYKVGREFAITRGHIHANAEFGELYYCVSGHGVMILETLEGKVSLVELTPGKAAHVPGHWVHRSANVGDEPFVTLFTYATEAGQDYGVISAAGGMKTVIVEDPDNGWKSEVNPSHTGYQAR